MKSKWVPELFEYGKKIIKELNYWGMGALEYKKDPRDGKFKFIELNVRPVLSIYKATVGGVNILFVGYQEIYQKTNQKSIIIPSPETNGLRWINLFEDFIVVMKMDHQSA